MVFKKKDWERNKNKNNADMKKRKNGIQKTTKNSGRTKNWKKKLQ